MEYIGYYNGKIGDLREMTIPMLDRSVFFGDSCYDMAVFAGRRVFALHDHINRFMNSCRLLSISFSMTEDELAGEIQRCVEAAEHPDGYVYWQASRGTMLRSFAYGDTRPVSNLIMYAGPGTPDPQSRPYRLRSFEDTRFRHCNIKTTNLIPAVLFSQRVFMSDCQECILHRGERVTECAHSNVIILKDGVLFAPPKDELILPGITMGLLLQLADDTGIQTRVEPFTMDALRDADEIIITSTGVHCIRGIELDGSPLGCKDPGRLIRLQQAFMDFYQDNLNRSEILDEAHIEGFAI